MIIECLVALHRVEAPKIFMSDDLSVFFFFPVHVHFSNELVQWVVHLREAQGLGELIKQ